MTTPNDMPRKSNPLHLQILGDLLANKTRVRTETRIKSDGKIKVIDKHTGETYKLPRYKLHKVDVEVPRLAGHVSELNIDRAARRWIP